MALRRRLNQIHQLGLHLLADHRLNQFQLLLCLALVHLLTSLVLRHSHLLHQFHLITHQHFSVTDHQTRQGYHLHLIAHRYLH